MAKIPFNVKFKPQIESGEYKVETATGKQARIICWDKKSDMNKKKIVALLDDGNSEHTEYYTENGTVYEKAPAGGDLFLITPEEELTEFEQAFGIAMMEAPEPEEKEERYLFLKEKSSELLAIARQELWPEIDAEIAKAYMNADEVMYRRGKEDALKEIIKEIFPLETDIETLKDLHTAIQENGIGCYKHGFEEGKKVALKDLPRWSPNDVYPELNDVVIGSVGIDDHFFIHRGRIIHLESLEKLPGFKEDGHE